ncbi:AAA family ATPase [Streptomyces sp. ISL-44]|uniref:nSTAND1 domain-containing NTPase n=1 Tax=Streptomyces sp. ISL-44 TaxID=2819184 RepID=UPI001BE5B93F|nr:ATP-binding protein [Streptomyces sp. ISL-44]MBT2543731.1 AAA family ATPase [Streptomyces sp. ISL-44]
MGARRDGFVVKIRQGTSDVPVGVGFVVGDKHIVTCAHVVNVALGRQKGTSDRPGDEARIQVEFVLLGDAEGAPLRNCRVTAWDPPPGPGRPGRDIAGLVLVGGDTLPVGAGPARLVDPRNGLAESTEVSVFGYPGTPPRKANGAWSSCVLRGAVGGGLVQLDTSSESALRTQPGYSGAAAIMSDRWGDAVIGMLAVASRGGEHEDAYAVPLSEMASAWPEVLERSVLPPCPYRGLQAFTAADARAGVFVGREREIERLRAMLVHQPCVVVAGPSGVGKSSLVGAGLEPALAADGWTVASFRPGSSPYDSVARALLDLEDPGAHHTLERLESRARSLREEGFWPVATRIALLTGRRLALIGDQFEEVLSNGAHGLRQEFLERMFPEPDTMDDAPVRLVCTLRSDFLPDLLDLPTVGPRIQDRQLNVSPLDEAALTRVIVEPAAAAGVVYSQGVAEAIAAEAAKAPGSLPLLEFALTELWPMQQERKITFDGYHALGGVSGALNRHAEKAFQFLARQLDEARIRRVLLSMVRARGGASSAVRVTALKAHLDRDWHVAQLLAEPDRRLVVLGTTGPGTAEIAHEALIREWIRLADWVDADADFQQWLAVMEERAADGDLLSATRVSEAEHWLSERSTDVPTVVSEFIERSTAAVLVQRHNEVMLTKSQELTEQWRERSTMLENRQGALQAANRQLEEKAARLARKNSEIEVQSVRIEEARQTLQEQYELLALEIRHKSEFLANMSHELRTPLSSLQLLAQELADNAAGTLTAKQVEYARAIQGAGHDLLSLLDDILDLSDAETGRMQIVPVRVPLLQVADHLDAAFSPLAEEKGLGLHVRVAPELPETLLADEQRLLQILRSLLANAVKFTDRGEVRLDIQPAGPDVPPPVHSRLADMKAAKLIAFSVADTGTGISDGRLKVIFEAFTHAGDPAETRHVGPGLGLSISREIARLMDGEIHVASERGLGSVFTLYLPLISGGPMAHPELQDLPAPEGLAEGPVSAQAYGFSGQKVLIVDDDVRAAFGLTTDFERHGLEVLWAERVPQAIATVTADPEVAVVLLRLPTQGMSAGSAAASVIAQLAGPPLRPVIALARKATTLGREKALAAGASDYAATSLDGEQLLPLIHHWLHQDQHAP